MQRLRVTFARGEATKYISHLDMMRYWERAFRRAGLPVALTQGFHPHPRFALASPLPVGVTGEAELMDVFLEPDMAPIEFLRGLSAQMVHGIEITGVAEMDPEGPSMQSLLRQAVYRVTVETDRSREAVEEALTALLARETLPWEHLRDGELRQYDLRAQIDSLWVEDCAPGSCVLGMQLRNGSGASGRPEQVTRALGFEERPLRIHRVRLVLAEPQAARPARS